MSECLGPPECDRKIVFVEEMHLSCSRYILPKRCSKVDSYRKMVLPEQWLSMMAWLHTGINQCLWVCCYNKITEDGFFIERRSLFSSVLEAENVRLGNPIYSASGVGLLAVSWHGKWHHGGSTYERERSHVRIGIRRDPGVSLTLFIATPKK